MQDLTLDQLAHIQFEGDIVFSNTQLEHYKALLIDLSRHIHETNKAYGSIRPKEIDFSEYERVFRYRSTYNEIIRKSVIISLIIHLEASLNSYCQNLFTYHNLSIKHTELKGNILERFKTYFKKIEKADFDFNDSFWGDIVGIYEVRNCIVHNSSELTGMKTETLIRTFVKTHPSLKINEHNQVELSNEACMEFIEIIQRFLNKIADYALQIFPLGIIVDPEEEFPF